MKKRSIHLPLVLALAAVTLLTLTCRLYPLNLFSSKTIGMHVNERAEDGQVSGSFVYPREEGNETVQFSVSTDGLASFWMEGASEDEILSVDIRQKETAQMRWKGTQMDGFGFLSTAEKAALDDLLLSDLSYGLGMIPLDIACQEEVLADPAQVAALLYPLQMRFKYQMPDRTTAASQLGALSQCSYGDNETDANQNTSMIIMMPSSPVPVVLGYFPFDPEGALEVSTTGSNDVKMASLRTSLLETVIENPSKITLSGINPDGPEPIRDEWGPCKAKCRGACGADCTTSNCKLTVVDRCERNQDGVNDGFKSIVYVYDCGLHPSCIKHDACYDACNSTYGCGSFSAAFCMHAETFVSAPFEYFSDSYLSCDSEVLIGDGVIDAADWMRGYGSQPTRQVFEYTDPDYGYDYDPVSCPPGEITVDEEPVEEPEEEPKEEADSSIAGRYIGKEIDKPPDWDLVEAQFFIDIADDGTVSGSRIYKIRMESVGPMCTTHYESTHTASFSGQITGSKGIMTVSSKTDNLVDDSSCSNGSYNLKTYDFVCEQSELTISGNDLEIVTKSSDKNSLCGAVFQATKQ